MEKSNYIRFRSHEQSQTHRDAIAAHISAKSTPVNAMLRSEVDSIQSKRRNSLMKQLSALRYLLQQGLSIRNDHSGGSNLTVMLQDVLDESLCVEFKKYQSPEIVNEMVQLSAHKVLRSLISDLLSQRWFALLADKTRDVSNHEQLVNLRWVSENYDINEDFFGLVNFFGLVKLDDTTANSIYLSLKNFLRAFLLKIAKDKVMMVQETSRVTLPELPNDLKMIIILLFPYTVLHIV